MRNAIVIIYSRGVLQPSGRRFGNGVSQLSPLRPVLGNGDPEPTPRLSEKRSAYPWPNINPVLLYGRLTFSVQKRSAPQRDQSVLLLGVTTNTVLPFT